MDDQFLPIVEDILENGLDPTAPFAAVPAEARSGHYRIIEGNRRLVALKALKKPKIVEGMVSAGRQRRLNTLSERFRSNPIKKATCVVFDTEREASRWIELRHTGANGGIGLVEWNSDDQDRYRSRHASETGRGRSPGGQVIDFVDAASPPEEFQTARILSNVQRLVGSTIVRRAFGIEVRARTVESWYPAEEFVRCWAPILADLRASRIKVLDIYDDPAKENFIKNLQPGRLPDSNLRMRHPIPLEQLGDPLPSGSGHQEHTESKPGSGAPGTSETKPDSSEADRPSATNDDTGKSNTENVPGGAGASRSRSKAPKPRSTVIPSSCSLWIPDGRINSIYRELLELDIEKYTNAASVLVRVFLELSVDSFLLSYKIVSEADRREASLAKRLKILVEHMASNNEITPQLEKAMKQVAEGSSVVTASATTFNQYVHNPYSFPKANDVRLAWDELQPLMTALWKRGR